MSSGKLDGRECSLSSEQVFDRRCGAPVFFGILGICRKCEG